MDTNSLERTTTSSLVPFQPFQPGRNKLRHVLTQIRNTSALPGRYLDHQVRIDELSDELSVPGVFFFQGQNENEKNTLQKGQNGKMENKLGR